MYKCSAVQQSVSRKQKVYCKLVNSFRKYLSYFKVVRSDFESVDAFDQENTENVSEELSSAIQFSGFNVFFCLFRE